MNEKLIEELTWELVNSEYVVEYHIQDHEEDEIYVQIIHYGTNDFWETCPTGFNIDFHIESEYLMEYDQNGHRIYEWQGITKKLA